LSVKNFLPDQYDATSKLEINHNYLQDQFSDFQDILHKVGRVVQKGDFTLGRAVEEFEQRYAAVIGTKHAIGLGSGTDALFLSLKALGVGPGDEVITTPFTFFATIGAIVTAGAKPVFVDVRSDYNIDASKIEQAITNRTKVILPVHWSGKPCEMSQIEKIAKKHDVQIVEDACHAIAASIDGKGAGSFGTFGCFSMHPLKNLNVWGDGGIACTNSDELADKLRLMRNHGLVGRDHCNMFAYNSRLDTIQAVIADHLLDKIENITHRRIENAKMLDERLKMIRQVTIQERDLARIKQVYHIYSLCFEKRDELQKYLISHGVDAKIHYPIPMHLQPAAKQYGHQVGDFPMAEEIANTTLSLPVHEFIEQRHVEKMTSLIERFYG
jgi:dTDP-3-amino-2,3,6-trideoxy-4-keto-D-glucose/dTDP-3-amino-3,4,6-trideoxy-alpha-D-glucose/dTDP-2,6-dideoxy-D-kanosamine transaminase